MNSPAARILGVFIKDHYPTQQEKDKTSKCYARVSVNVAYVSKDGIVGSFDWHQIAENQAKYAVTDFGERGVLVQTAGNVAKLLERFPQAAATLAKTDGSAFGENLLIDSLDSSEVCVGDVIGVIRGNELTPKAVFQVVSPCAPCAKIANFHKIDGVTPSEGVKGHCAEHGLRGYFFRVIQEGTVAPGDSLVLVARPHSDWTLERVSQLCYGGENKHGIITEFLGTETELNQVLNLPLAEIKWKLPVRELIKKRTKLKFPLGGMFVLLVAAAMMLRAT